MSAPPIAPLAQRLAEENNVDWRALEGSGEEGRVVERDVLGYLTQVMRGKAAADPTPEPLPDGLAAWPEELARPPKAAPPQNEPPDAPDTPWTLRLSAPPQGGVKDSAEKNIPEKNIHEKNTVEKNASEKKTTELEPDGEVFTFSPPIAGVTEDAKRDKRYSAKDGVEPSASLTAEPDGIQLAAPEELRELRAKLAQLEAERGRHLEELNQLARLQETIAAQKAEKARTDTLQGEVKGLTEELERVRAEAQRLAPLEAALHDREERLARARLFKTKAKAEVERLLGYIAGLEGELATLRTHPRWKFWG